MAPRTRPPCRQAPFNLLRVEFFTHCRNTSANRNHAKSTMRASSLIKCIQNEIDKNGDLEIVRAGEYQDIYEPIKVVWLITDEENGKRLLVN